MVLVLCSKQAAHAGALLMRSVSRSPGKALSADLHRGMQPQQASALCRSGGRPVSGARAGLPQRPFFSSVTGAAGSAPCGRGAPCFTSKCSSCSCGCCGGCWGSPGDSPGLHSLSASRCCCCFGRRGGMTTPVRSTANMSRCGAKCTDRHSRHDGQKSSSCAHTRWSGCSHHGRTAHAGRCSAECRAGATTTAARVQDLGFNVYPKTLQGPPPQPPHGRDVQQARTRGLTSPHASWIRGQSRIEG